MLKTISNAFGSCATLKNCGHRVSSFRDRATNAMKSMQGKVAASYSSALDAITRNVTHVQPRLIKGIDERKRISLDDQAFRKVIETKVREGTQAHLANMENAADRSTLALLRTVMPITMCTFYLAAEQFIPDTPLIVEGLPTRVPLFTLTATLVGWLCGRAIRNHASLSPEDAAQHEQTRVILEKFKIYQEALNNADFIANVKRLYPNGKTFPLWEIEAWYRWGQQDRGLETTLNLPRETVEKF